MEDLGIIQEYRDAPQYHRELRELGITYKNLKTSLAYPKSLYYICNKNAIIKKEEIKMTQEELNLKWDEKFRELKKYQSWDFQGILSVTELIFLKLSYDENATKDEWGERADKILKSAFPEYDYEDYIGYLEEQDLYDVKYSLIRYLDMRVKDENIVNVLPLMRRLIKSVWPLIDQALEWDLPAITYRDNYLGLKEMLYNVGDNEEILPLQYEPDRVSFVYSVETYGQITGKAVLNMIAIIMGSDCSGCCNALDYIKVSKIGIISTGDVSGTYHS